MLTVCLSRKITTDWLHCQSGPLCADNDFHRKGWCSDTWQSAVLVLTGTSANMTAIGCSYLDSSTSRQRRSAIWVTVTSVQIRSDSAYSQEHTESKLWQRNCHVGGRGGGCFLQILQIWPLLLHLLQPLPQPLLLLLILQPLRLSPAHAVAHLTLSS